MVLVDFNGLAIGSIMGQLSHGEELSENLVKHIILNNLRVYRNKYKEVDYGKMVICCDSASWRKDVFPEYKASRKTNRAKDKHDWPMIFDLIEDTLNDLRSNFPYAVIKIDKAEADDIIGVLTKNAAMPLIGEEVVIISADKDFIQLQSDGHVKQWSPMFNKMIIEDNPRRYLFDHILKGDSSDGVPNANSHDDVFVSSARQTPMTQKAISKYWDNRDDLESIMKPNVYRNFMRNAQMIDLENTPDNIRDESINKYENYEYPPRTNILTYLIENRMKMLIDCAGEF
jgi:5'-3' exonuclease|tara:strand:- start:125 stop:982 length:858 start_codon:yes stop_codon:yes gene_type:complete